MSDHEERQALLSTDPPASSSEAESPVLGVNSREPQAMIATHTILERVRQCVSEQIARGASVLMPQALVPDEQVAFEPIDTFPWRRAIGSREPIHIKELTKAPESALPARLYRIILCRNPQELEARAAADLLVRGWHPVALAARIRWSKEGRAIGLAIQGLTMRFVPAIALSLIGRTRTPLGN
jgi:hypothetical protein